jgi:NhaA family Na+:H+ antiporter
MATASSPTRGLLTRYLSVEAASGLVLALATVAALVLANSRWAGAYEATLAWRMVVDLGSHSLEIPLSAFVNDGLMTLFFFTVGLEIRREMHAGELADAPRAALPAAAALGGMIAPAVLYALLNPSGPAQRGWGIPMATDIAFAVGVLTLFGSRVPAALRIVLLALAVIDDIGAIVVIAVFYNQGGTLTGVLLAGSALLVVLALRTSGILRR